MSHPSRSVHRLGFAASLALALGASTTAEAQTSISPYFMVMVDTSGSMNGNTGGGNNSCGQPHDRLSDAKCVLQRVVYAYGDVTFGLGRFQQSYSGGSCGTPCTSGSCGCTGRTSRCDDTAASGQILVPIAARNQEQIIDWVDYSCGSCTATAGTNVELRSGGNTPLEGALLAARDYFLSPTGAVATDTYRGCRPVNVILLTDGDETCGGNPRDGATALRNMTIGGVTVDVHTYPIGFGVTPGDSGIENLAIAGGTDAPGSHRGFYATDETTLALAFSQIIADSIRVEVCNGVDDNCNGIIDEGFPLYCNLPSHPARDLCTDPGEVCDGIDNNCDGTTDEGFPLFCNRPAGHSARDLCTDPGEVCNGIDDNCNGIIDEGGVCVSGCTPTLEICDGIDNDCDGTIDNITRPCGSSTGVCTTGTQLCTAGVWGTCSGTGPSPEACDGLDNDCDGIVDGQVRACGSAVGACTPGAQQCVAGGWGTCIGSTGPFTEICNLIDDDCNGATDEGDPGGGGTCGSSIGVCTPGTYHCMGGSIMCIGGTSPGPEVCNVLDDDCDGRIDEGNPGGGATCGPAAVGACRPGIMACTSGMLTCVGRVFPTPEVCNGADDDCDGTVDEGNPEGGAPCGSDEGACVAGTTLCSAGTLVCDGAIGPTPEVCNAIDDDCNTVIDDGIPVGAACGSDVGECSPGLNVCDPATGTLTCSGAFGPTDELCDLLDNDCDGSVDETLATGGPCGTAEGACMPGTLECVGGRETCVGEVGPATEVCDCSDNDCDGSTDEPPMTGSLCPSGSACVDCQCALPCMMSEFGFICPGGRSPRVDTSGECYCVAELCNATACGMETQMSAGEVACAPDDPTVSTCVCRGPDCTFPCEGVTCGAGLVCDPRDPGGRCVEDNCNGLGCPAGEVCDEASGACVTDPCDTTDCPAGEACRAGVCETSCADVSCASGERCHAGACEADACIGSVCSASGEACDPTDGSCVPDLCVGNACRADAICDPITGSCVDDPCNALHCPAGQACEMGECRAVVEMPDAGPPTMMDAGPPVERDAGGPPPDLADRVLAAGGCMCRVGVSSPGSQRSGALALLGLVLAIVVRRRRRAGRRAAGGDR